MAEGKGFEVGVGYFSLIPVAPGVQGAIAKQMAPAANIAAAQGKRSGNAFAQAFNQFGGKKIAAALTVGGMVAFGKKSVDAFKSVASESLALQRVMGGTVHQASEWRGAMQLGGLSAQQFSVSAKKLSQEIQKTGAKGKGPLHDLGVNVKNAAGQMRSMDDLLPEIAEKFKNMPNGAQKTALAVQLFGRSGLQMLPFLNRGAAGLAALKKQAEKAGIVIGDDGVNAFKKNLAASRMMKAQWQGLQIFVGQKLLPVITIFVGWMSKLVAVMSEHKWVAGLVGGLAAGVVAFKLITSATRGWGAALNAVKANPVIAIISGLILLGMWLVHEWKTSERFRDIVKGVLAALQHAWENFMHAIDNVRHAWDNVWHAGENVVNFFSSMPGKITGFFSNAWQWLVNAGSNILRGLINGLKWFWDNVLYWYFIGIPKKIILFFANAGVWLINAGSNVLRGIWSGLKWFWDNVLYWYFIGIPKKIKDFFTGAVSWLYDKGQAVIQGFWDGLTYIWNKVTGWVSGLARWIKDHKGPISLDKKLLYPAGKAIMNGFFKGLKHGWNSPADWIKGIAGMTVDTVGSVMFGPMYPMVKGAMNGMIKGLLGQAQSIIGGFMPGGPYSGGALIGDKNLFEYSKQVMAMLGMDPATQFPFLYQLWSGESGWNPKAVNASSGATGIPQALPGSKILSEGPMFDAAAQIRWGLKYILGRYGTPQNALAFWLSQKPHWYKEGAWEIDANKLGYLHKGEMVIPAQYAAGIRNGGPGGGVTIEQKFYGSTSAADKRNVDAAAREMAWAYRTLT